MNDESNQRVGGDMNHDQVAGNLSEIFAFKNLHGKGDSNSSFESCNC